MKSARPAFSLDVASLEAVDSVCIQFENALRQGRDPCILDELSGKSQEHAPALVSELLALESNYLSEKACAARIARYRQALPHLSWVINGVAVSNAPTTDSVLPNNDDLIGAYQVVKKLGQGTFGVVCLAIDSRNGRQVALKTAMVNSVHRCDPIQREITFLRRLTHPSIIELLDVVDNENGSTMVMAFAAGGTLREHLDTAREDLQLFVHHLISLVDGIEYAHTQGVVHRDIEPGNILINKDGRFILADFGLAIHESDQPDANGESAGSMAYMSPEQVRGESHWLDGRADIWAIGVVLYECLTGRRPFPADDRATLTDEILYKPIKPPRQINPQICATLEDICLQCLSRAANQRYSTASDLSNDLAMWHRAKRRGQTRLRLVGYASIAAAVLVATLAILVPGRGDGVDPIRFDEQNSPLPVTEAGTIQDLGQRPQNLSSQERNQLWPLRDSYERFSFRVSRSDQIHDIDSQNALPLHADDELWVLGATPPDWSVLAFLVDSCGNVHHLDTPEGAIAWRRIPSGVRGSEAIVLISSKQNIQIEAARASFPQLADQSGIVSLDTMRYINGAPTTRSTLTSTDSELPAMYSNQRLIAEAFRGSGCHVHAVIYGVSENE